MSHHPNDPMEFINRTLTNLQFIDDHAKSDGPYEIQQVILSFLTLVAFPREKYLNSAKLKWILLDDDLVTQQLKFPKMESSWEFDTERPPTLDALTRLLRNAIAHGNIELLKRDMLEARRENAPIPSDLPDNEIAGVELWNVGNKGRTWGTILTESEMRETLQAMKRLTECEQFRVQQTEPLNGGRPTPQKRLPSKPNSGSRVADSAHEQPPAPNRRNSKQQTPRS